MTTIMPEGKRLRDAVKWISEQREQSDLPLVHLVQKAATRYNLSPKEELYLLNVFSNKNDQEES
jgi:hypothetical protein